MTTGSVGKVDGNQSDSVIPGADLLRGAYVLGRNFQLLEGWLESVAAIARCRPERQWDWDYPDTLFGGSFDAWPEHWYWEVDEALQTMVLMQIVDDAALSELRRHLDVACVDCGEVADFAANDLWENIGETHWHGRYNLSCADKFGDWLLKGSPERLVALRRMGCQVGQLKNRLAHYNDPTSELALLRRTVALGEDLFGPQTIPLIKLKDAIPTNSARCLADEWASCRNLVECLQELDDWIIEQVPVQDISIEPLLMLDDRRETLTYFGIDIPFADFRAANALGGLEILRVLIRRPQRAMRASEILERSKLCAVPEQMSAYLARFRRVLKRTKNLWPPDVLERKDRFQAALKGFIESDQIARNQTASIDTWYKLDLPPYRVRYVPFDLI